MSARTEQAPLVMHQRHVATANGAEEHESSVADGGMGSPVLSRHSGSLPERRGSPAWLNVGGSPAEHCQGRVGALAHHGFKGNARYVDELAQFGAPEQTLRGFGHAEGFRWTFAREYGTLLWRGARVPSPSRTPCQPPPRSS